MTYMLPSGFKNLQAISTTHTSVQSTSNYGNSFITLSGSEITYTPHTSSTKVIYEISFYGEKSGYPWMNVQIQHADEGASNWTEINARYKRNVGVSGYSSQTNRYYIVWRYVLPTWSGAKQLRIRMASHNANRSFHFHKLEDWDGTSATDKFCNTNLIVYSV